MVFNYSNTSKRIRIFVIPSDCIIRDIILFRRMRQVSRIGTTLEYPEESRNRTKNHVVSDRLGQDYPYRVTINAINKAQRYRWILQQLLAKCCASVARRRAADVVRDARDKRQIRDGGRFRQARCAVAGIFHERQKPPSREVTCETGLWRRDVRMGKRGWKPFEIMPGTKFGTRLISNVARFATGQRRERRLRPKYEGTPRERFAVLASRGHFHEIVPRTKIIQSLFVRAYTDEKRTRSCSPWEPLALSVRRIGQRMVVRSIPEGTVAGWRLRERVSCSWKLCFPWLRGFTRSWVENGKNR